MNLDDILQRLQNGEEVTAAEKAFVARELGVSPTAAAEDVQNDADLESVVDAAIQRHIAPILADRQRATDPPVQAAEQDRDNGQWSYTPRVNTYSDMLRAMYRGQPIGHMLNPEHMRQRGLNETTDAQGGYLVPDATFPELIRTLNEYGVARQYCRVIPISTDTIRINSVATGMTASYTDEQGSITATKPSFDRDTVTAKKLATITDPISSELLEDSEYDLFTLIGILAGEAMAYKEDDQLFNGTGSPFTGILNATSVNEVEVTGTIADVSINHLIELTDKVKAGHRNGARWYMNRTVASIVKKLKDDNGGLYWIDPREGQPATFLGYPVEYPEAMPTASSVSQGEAFIAFGNLNNVAFFDRRVITPKILDQATITDSGASDVSLAQTDQVAIRHTQRHYIHVLRPDALARVALAA